MDDLFPEERSYISRAIHGRQIEFATARVCARQALAELGVARGPMVPSPDRSPSWPPGTRGAISHTIGCCVVAVTRAPGVLGVGLDVEAAGPLGHRLAGLLATPCERSWLLGLATDVRGVMLKALFVAKEAVYKCQYPLSGKMLSFLDVEIELHPSLGSFRVARIGGSCSSRRLADGIEGQIRFSGAVVIATAVLRSSAS